MREPDPFFFRCPAIPIDSVMAQVDSGEDNFAVTAIDQSTYLSKDVLHRPARELRPHVRDDTEAAAQHAAVLHFDVSAMPPAKAADSRGNLCDPESPQQIGQFPL